MRKHLWGPITAWAITVGLLVGAVWTTMLSASAQADQPDRPIQVYFSRRPESDDDFTAVFPVSRTAPDAGVARAALNALIAGPTPAETDAGYFSELGQMLVGPSDCGEDGFTIRIAAGIATLRFCRDVRSAGIGQDARAQSAIDATLTQFPTIRRIRILTREGDCLFDMSGENRCLTAATNPAPLQSF
jgi:hypothetical protein